ncbi:MAG: hypothetical protein IH600_11345 [Bacteroidetes bacterium]|nr:hypothetical protein [Bacteroidota bacterium]
MKTLVWIFMAGLCLAASPLYTQDVETQLAGNSASQGFTVKTNSSINLFTIRGDGTIGIGTATPTAGFDVKQSGTLHAGYFHIDNVTSSSDAIFAESKSTDNFSDAVRALAVGGRALFCQNSGTVATADLKNNGSGRAILATNNSPTSPTITAVNDNASPGAPLLAAHGTLGQAFVVDREGDVSATGTVTADAFTATTTLNTGTPAVGRMYRDNVVYVWGKVKADGTFSGQSFGIQSVTRNTDTTYTITFKTTFASIDDYAVVVSPVNNATFEIATPLPQSANSVKVKIHYVSFSPSNIIRRDFYDDFFIIVTGRP